MTVRTPDIVSLGRLSTDSSFHSASHKTSKPLVCHAPFSQPALGPPHAGDRRTPKASSELQEVLIPSHARAPPVPPAASSGAGLVVALLELLSSDALPQLESYCTAWPPPDLPPQGLFENNREKMSFWRRPLEEKPLEDLSPTVTSVSPIHTYI